MTDKTEGVAAEKTVPLVPSWAAAVSICIMVLDNPRATDEAKQPARDELMRLARAMDDIIEDNRRQAEENDSE